MSAVRVLGVVVRLLFKPGDDKRCLELEGLKFLVCNVRFCGQKQLAVRLLGLKDATRASSAALRPGDSSDGDSVSQPGLCFCESVFRGCPWVRESLSSQDGVNTSMVPPGGFSVAASFTMLKLSVQE